MDTDIAGAARAQKLHPFDEWLENIGASRATGWRYRQRGWIAVLNRAGRLYVTENEIERFNERLKAGEFSRLKSAPHLKGCRGKRTGIFGGRLRSFFRSLSNSNRRA